MSRALLRALAVLVLLSGAAVTATGCVMFGACPAIGWSNGLTLDTSAVPGVDGVQFCADGECSPLPGAEPSSSTNMFVAVPQDDGTWTLRFDMSAPELVQIRLFDAQGTLIHESDQAIVWTHSDAPCGGPSTADPLILQP